MNTKDLLALGVPSGTASSLAFSYMKRRFAAGADRPAVESALSQMVADPAPFLHDADARDLATELLRVLHAPPFVPRAEPAPWRQWAAADGLEPGAVRQMANACSLPVTVAGALMPDAHVGYGLPIGGVLATENAVIPFAVGVDIACRMKLSVYDCPARRLAGMRDRLANILESETRFGVGVEWKLRREHDVMDEEWGVSPVTARLKGKAWAQLGTSGSGNHFVEFGAFTVSTGTDAAALGLPPGEYLSLLSHSGSRGTGAQVCEHYSKRAMELHPELPKELRHLAWLPLVDGDSREPGSAEGQEYWAAMSLMGRYAAANHAIIHRQIARQLGEKIVLDIENHHNFAWRERHVVGVRKDGTGGVEREVIVHRKGATPAARGVLGIIPGSMAAPGYLVRGKGGVASLASASHGAGRVMSRTKAMQSFTWGGVKKQLAAAGVELLSAGLDEAPGVYKDIDAVMAAQGDLVETLARFDPKLVKMCPGGEQAED